MAGMSNDEEAAVLDLRLSSTHWLGLSTTTPIDTGGNIVEPSTGSYARVAVTDGDWAAAVAGAPTSKANDTEITFAVAMGDWASGSDLTDFILMSESVSGTMKYSGPITTPKPVLSGDTARLGVGDLRILLGDTGDSYA